jgi:hypothetical protein
MKKRRLLQEEDTEFPDLNREEKKRKPVLARVYRARLI